MNDFDTEVKEVFRIIRQWLDDAGGGFEAIKEWFAEIEEAFHVIAGLVNSPEFQALADLLALTLE